MTDGQFQAIVAVLGTFLAGLLGTIRWATGRITKAIDDGAVAQRESAKEAAAAQLEQSRALREQAVEFATLRSKIDDVTKFVHEHTPVEMNSGPVRVGSSPSIVVR